MTNVFERTTTIISEDFMCDKSTLFPSTKVWSFCEDSLDILQLLVAIEDEFGAFISDDDCEKFSDNKDTTIQDIVDAINRELDYDKTS